MREGAWCISELGLIQMPPLEGESGPTFIYGVVEAAAKPALLEIIDFYTAEEAAGRVPKLELRWHATVCKHHLTHTLVRLDVKAVSQGVTKAGYDSSRNLSVVLSPPDLPNQPSNTIAMLGIIARLGHFTLFAERPNSYLSIFAKQTEQLALDMQFAPPDVAPLNEVVRAWQHII